MLSPRGSARRVGPNQGCVLPSGRGSAPEASCSERAPAPEGGPPVRRLFDEAIVVPFGFAQDKFLVGSAAGLVVSSAQNGARAKPLAARGQTGGLARTLPGRKVV